MHTFVAVYLNIYVPISLCGFKTKLARQNKMDYQAADLGKAVILDIIILYDSLTDGLQNYKKW